MSRSNDGLPMLPPWLADTEVTGVGEGNFRNYEPPPVQNLPQDEVIPETPEPPEGFFSRRGRGDDRPDADKKKGKGWFRNNKKDQPSLEERVGELLPNNNGPRPAQRNNWAEATGRHEWATPPDERSADTAVPRHTGTDPARPADQAAPPAPYPPADRPEIPARSAPGPGPQWGPDTGAALPPAAPNSFRAPAVEPAELPVRHPGEPAPEFDRLRPHHPIPPHPAAESPVDAHAGAGGSPTAPDLPDPPPVESSNSAAPESRQQPLRRLPDLLPPPSDIESAARDAAPESATPDRTVPPAPDEWTAPSTPDPADSDDAEQAPAARTSPDPAPLHESAGTPDPFAAPESTPPMPRSGPTESTHPPHSAPPPRNDHPGDIGDPRRADRPAPPPNQGNPQQWRAPESVSPGPGHPPRPPVAPPPGPQAPGPQQHWQQPGPPPQAPGPAPAQHHPAAPQWQQPPPRQQGGSAPGWQQQGGAPSPQQQGGPPPQQQGGPPPQQHSGPPPQPWQQNPAQFGAPGPGPSLDDVAVRRAKKASGQGWRKVVHHASGGRINPGMSAEERRLQELVARIRQPVRGDYRIAVLSLKGGVGKTTTTVGLGSTFASVRGDRVIAVDANPDFGTLSQRVPLQTRSTVRDLLLDPSIERYSDVRRHTSQATSRLEVLASERDPAASEAFNEDEYRAVARILQRFYNIILTDCGTGLMHSAMAGVLQLAHSLVLISPTAIDGAQSASATLDWLSLHGYHHLVQNAVVVINSPRDGTPNIDVQQLRQYFLSRCRAVHMIPFDPHMSEGAEIDLPRLEKQTKRAYVELAATVADDFTQSYRPHPGG
ncbi:nucleotide-binding protein [Nocardia sp. NPDC001965]